MQQMQWHEELDELREQPDTKQLNNFKTRIKQTQTNLEAEFDKYWQDHEYYLHAEQLVRRMQFMDKLTLSVKQLEEHLDD